MMTLSPLAYGLLALLAIALVVSVWTDVRARIIPNWLNAAIALTAPVFWYAIGDSLWPDVAVHLLTALIVFVFFLIMFRFGMMGGGDVKLLTVLSLWLPWQGVYELVLYSSLLGIAVTAAFWGWHKLRKAEGAPKYPMALPSLRRG